METGKRRGGRSRVVPNLLRNRHIFLLPIRIKASWAQIYSGAATRDSVSGLAPGSYSYRVRGCNPESVCSSYSAAFTTSVAEPPPAPGGLTGPPFSIDGSYTIDWDNVSGAASYRLDEKLGSGSWTQVYSGSSSSKSLSGRSDGTYTYRVRACNVEDACGSWSGTFSLDVQSTPPPPPAAPTPGPNVDPGPSSAAESDTIGTTAGNFRVDESGAATYTIPIAAAAGTAGVAPQISLVYRFAVASLLLFGAFGAYAVVDLAAVDTAGISVTGLRFAAVGICGLLCGLAGAYLATALQAGFVKDMTAGRGFIALAALIFAKWRPWHALGACLLFGLLQAVALRSQGAQVLGVSVPVQAIDALPYILTVVILAGFVGKAIPPRAGGEPYVKER